MVDFMFGTFDIETCTNSMGKFIPYCAAGFIGRQKIIAYHDDVKYGVSDVILIALYDLCAVLKKIGRSSPVLFAHNLSSFDGYFLLNTFASANIHVDILKRGNEIIYLKVCLNGIKLEFRCSLLLLRQDLNSCATSFNVRTTKLSMDHEWVRPDRLFYYGVTPLILVMVSLYTSGFTL